MPDHLARFIHQENIRHFERTLEEEIDVARRKLLEALLTEEREKLVRALEAEDKARRERRTS
jgi:hypothetical protein